MNISSDCSKNIRFRAVNAFCHETLPLSVIASYQMTRSPLFLR